MSDPYAYPALYDLEYQHQSDDVAFYVAIASRSNGPVLELGCGNGRLLLPIARSGVHVVGIDASTHMLEDLRQKLKKEPQHVVDRVKLLLGDYRVDRIPGTFPLVIWPFNALHHCPSGTDVVAALHNARKALEPGGTLYLDCYLPDRSLYSRDPDRRYEERTFVDPRDGTELTSWEQGSWDEAKRIHHVIYVYQRPDGHEDRVHLQLHMYEREELLAFVREAGLKILWQASDFFGSPLQAKSLKWVMQLVPA